MKDLIVSGGRREHSVQGNPALPADKSISHRALLFASATDGWTEIEGLNTGTAVLPLVEALQALGAPVEWLGPGHVRMGALRGRRGSADVPYVNLGPSSAAARLLIGLLAGLGVEAVVDGDATLRSRPIDWIVDPLRELGADLEYAEGEVRLPVRIRRAALRDGEVSLKVGSAQAHSAVALAAFGAGISAVIHQPVLSRDHTLRLMAHLGASVEASDRVIRVRPGPRKPYPHHRIPADPSAAAYLAAAHLFARRESTLRLSGLCLNPTRLGFFDTLSECGFGVGYEDRDDAFGEPIGTVAIHPSRGLRPIRMDQPFRFHAMIDEIPLAAAVAATLPGDSRFGRMRELEFKETNRLHTTRDMLAAFGGRIIADEEGLAVLGGAPLIAATVPSFGDHRIAMTAAALGCGLPGSTRVREGACAGTSFPGYAGTLRTLGHDVREVEPC